MIPLTSPWYTNQPAGSENYKNTNNQKLKKRGIAVCVIKQEQTLIR